uniref:Uncharacterized protein n=1 Tax=Ditylenchus dipsaci TaxID=166011 RepID=A0A915E4S0_9BILA
MNSFVYVATMKFVSKQKNTGLIGSRVIKLDLTKADQTKGRNEDDDRCINQHGQSRTCAHAAYRARTAPITYTDDGRGCYVWTKTGRTSTKNRIEQGYFRCSGCQARNESSANKSKVAPLKFNISAATWLDDSANYTHICEPKSTSNSTGRLENAACEGVEAVKAALYRSSRERFPNITTFPQFLADENRRMRLTLRATACPVSDDDMLIFSSPPQLNLLRSCTHIISGGTFKYAPNGVKRIYRVFAQSFTEDRQPGDAKHKDTLRLRKA